MGSAAAATLGASVAPFLFGMIADSYGLYAGFYFLAGVIICANALVFFIPDEKLKVAPAAAARFMIRPRGDRNVPVNLSVHFPVFFGGIDSRPFHVKQVACLEG